MLSENNTIKLVDDLLAKAQQLRASDIHLEPTGRGLGVRLRIDGLLRQSSEYHGETGAAVASRLKILAGLDIGEKRLGQDGRFGRQIKDLPGLDIRVATIPTIDGEKLVLRLLPKERSQQDLAGSGLAEDQLELFRRILKRAAGLVLVTGPTGCGKTTTLYGCLSELADQSLNITTIEDPIEYRQAGINQVQVNQKSGLTFAAGLRSILRQDPDVILVGEIRDAETAQIAVRAALTGHLVLATMHTTDGLGAVSRLLEMGIEPYLLAPCLSAIAAQRLVRLLCPHCKRKTAFDWPASAFASAGKAGRAIELLTGRETFQPAGCPACQETGYQGRTGVFEIVDFDDALKDLLLRRAPWPELRAEIARQGGRDLWLGALNRVLSGQTSLVEVGRVLGT